MSKQPMSNMPKKNPKNPEKYLKCTICPNCSSNNIVKKGIRKNKLKTFQQYQCKSCSHIFRQNPSRNKTYPIETILKAIKEYNLGYSLSQVKQKLKTTATLPTISNWLNEYKPLTPYNNLRKEAAKLYPKEEMIEQHRFLHNNLPYTYQLHRAKLDLLFKSQLYNNPHTNHKKFQKPLTQYLHKIPTKDFPHKIFKPKTHQSTLESASNLKFNTNKFIKQTKNNLANKLAALALNLAKDNKQRHAAIQNFMLINDSTTIATEIPVYLTNDDIKYFKKRNFKLNLDNHSTPITGHIDILQIRNSLIHILDYKPKANKTSPINQLITYALALASRTKLDLRSFKCAWFDENNYYGFYPLHAVYIKG